MFIRVSRGTLVEEGGALISASDQHELSLIYGNNWLKCNCNPTKPAILTIRKLPTGMYTLMNISGRGEHLANCEFSYEKVQSKISINNNKNFRFPRKRKEETTKKSSFSAGTSHPEGVLSRLLTELLSQSGFFLIQPEREFKDNIEVLNVDGAGAITVNGYSLSDRISYGFDRFMQVKNTLLAEIGAGSNAAPWFIFDIVDEVHKESGNYQTTKHYSANLSKSFNFYQSYTDVHADIALPGPYLVFSVIDDESKSQNEHRIVPKKTIIKSIANKHQWVPINSLFERLAIKKLESAQAWYKSNTGIDFEVEVLAQSDKHAIYGCRADSSYAQLIVSFSEPNQGIEKDQVMATLQKSMELKEMDSAIFSGVNKLFNKVKSEIKGN